MGYNKIILHGGQVCDYLYIQKELSDDELSNFKEVNSEPDSWNDKTLLFSKFNNNMIAGNSSLTGSIVGYEVRRQKGTDSYTEYVGTVKKTEDNTGKYIIDYIASNKCDYTYYLYPSSFSKNGIVLSPFVTEEVSPDWEYWSLLVVDETKEDNVFYINKIFKFELNLATDDMSNNAVVSVMQNFTKYPTIQYGTSNYWSGGLTALCGFISCSDDDYIQTPNMINELKSLTSDTRRKFLKDMDGNIWEVKITAPITISTNDQTLERIKSVKLSWAEVGDVSGISITNNPNTPLTSWLLTETGEAVPYVEYVWEEHYKWDNSYRWTANEDVLKTETSHIGRDLE